MWAPLWVRPVGLYIEVKDGPSGLGLGSGASMIK